MEYKNVADVSGKTKEGINSCKTPKKSNNENKHAERKIFTKKEEAKK